MRFRGMWLAVFVVIVLMFVAQHSGHAQQSTVRMVSPALSARNGDFLECTVVNVTSVHRTIRIRAFDGNGNVTTQTGPLTINPNGVSGVSMPGTNGVIFEIVAEGKGSYYRASMSIIAADGSGSKVALPIPPDDAQ